MSFLNWLGRDSELPKIGVLILIAVVTIVTYFFGVSASVGGMATILLVEYLSYRMEK